MRTWPRRRPCRRPCDHTATDERLLGHRHRCPPPPPSIPLPPSLCPSASLSSSSPALADPPTSCATVPVCPRPGHPRQQTRGRGCSQRALALLGTRRTHPPRCERHRHRHTQQPSTRQRRCRRLTLLPTLAPPPPPSASTAAALYSSQARRRSTPRPRRPPPPPTRGQPRTIDGAIKKKRAPCPAVAGGAPRASGA